MRPTTYVLLMFLIVVMWFAWLSVSVPEAEGAGGVQGGPYWNEKVYRQQQQQRTYQNNLQTQQLMMNSLQMQRYHNQTQRMNNKPVASQYKHRQVKPTSSSSWNYRRANE